MTQDENQSHCLLILYDPVIVSKNLFCLLSAFIRVFNPRHPRPIPFPKLPHFTHRMPTPLALGLLGCRLVVCERNS